MYLFILVFFIKGKTHFWGGLFGGMNCLFLGQALRVVVGGPAAVGPSPLQYSGRTQV